MFRRCTVATWCAAWRNPSGSSAFFTISVSVVPAPIACPLSFISGMWRRETSILGAIWRRFMFGSRSVPPAMSMASGPSPARMRAASPTERGARYSNHGSRIILLDLLAVAAFPRRRHDERLRVGDRREVLGAYPRFFTFAFLLQRLENLVRRNGEFVDTHADGVVDRIRHRRHDRQQRALPGFLRAERAVGIRLLDEHRVDFRHAARG